MISRKRFLFHNSFSQLPQAYTLRSTDTKKAALQSKAAFFLESLHILVDHVIHNGNLHIAFRQCFESEHSKHDNLQSMQRAADYHIESKRP